MPHTHTWPLSIHNNTTMHVLCALHRECLYRLIYRMEHIWYVPFGRSAVCLGVWVFGVAGFIWLLRLLMFDSLDVWHSAHAVSSMYAPPFVCVCVCDVYVYTSNWSDGEGQPKGVACVLPPWLTDVLLHRLSFYYYLCGTARLSHVVGARQRCDWIHPTTIKHALFHVATHMLCV